MEIVTLSWLQLVMEMIGVFNIEIPNCPSRTSMIWTSLYWKYHLRTSFHPIKIL